MIDVFRVPDNNDRNWEEQDNDDRNRHGAEITTDRVMVSEESSEEASKRSWG